MWKNIFKNISLNKVHNVKFNCTSALYITGDRAQDNFAVLTPYIDVVERFENRALLEANIKARGINLDLDAIASRWGFYQNLMEKRHVLSYTKTEISKELSNLLKDEAKNQEEIAKLKSHIAIVKDEYSTLKHFMYGVEESAALKALSLPNVLHEKTPTNKTEGQIFEHLAKPHQMTPSHIDLGKENDWLEVHDNSFAFLTNEAALFEIALVNMFQQELLQAEIIQFSNTDFARSVIVEGCGTDFTNKRDVITINDGNDHTINRLHLTGSASHYAFMAYCTRLAVPLAQLPLNFFAIGRKYQPQELDTEVSLHNLLQQSAIEVFSAAKCDADIDDHFQKLSSVLSKLYESIGCHFRFVLKPADQLKNYESLRMDIEMFSNYYNKYVDVGSLSLVDDYLSKRLLFTYSENKDRKYPKVLMGNVLNIQKVLACVIENQFADGKKELINSNLRKYLPLDV